MKKSVYYLSAKTSSTLKYVVFKAKFSETCDIAYCYVIASSLHHASLIIYERLSHIYDADYLDSHLLSLEFHRSLSNFSF